jgi:hypothetical protein
MNKEKVGHSDQVDVQYKKQTSVEWLVKKLEESGIPLMKDDLEMIEEAKRMNEIEIISSYQQGCMDGIKLPHFGNGKNYYRETYNR